MDSRRIFYGVNESRRFVETINSLRKACSGTFVVALPQILISYTSATRPNLLDNIDTDESFIYASFYLFIYFFFIPPLFIQLFYFWSTLLMAKKGKRKSCRRLKLPCSANCQSFTSTITIHYLPRDLAELWTVFLLQIFQTHNALNFDAEQTVFFAILIFEPYAVLLYV